MKAQPMEGVGYWLHSCKNHGSVRKVRFWLDYVKWDKHSFPPPHYVKQRIVLKYAAEYRCSTLIETGTYLGFMVEAMRNHFRQVVSIELDPVLCNNAAAKFRRYPHIQIREGNSATVLPEVLRSIDVTSCLFWLDGHYSGGITARGERDTPILSELHSVFRYATSPVILIDDARCFTGEHDYPSLEQIEDLALTNGFSFANQNDVIRLTPLAGSVEALGQV